MRARSRPTTTFRNGYAQTDTICISEHVFSQTTITVSIQNFTMIILVLTQQKLFLNLYIQFIYLTSPLYKIVRTTKQITRQHSNDLYFCVFAHFGQKSSSRTDITIAQLDINFQPHLGKCSIDFSPLSLSLSLSYCNVCFSFSTTPLLEHAEP